MKLSRFQVEISNACQPLREKLNRGELTREQYFQAVGIARKEIAARLRRERKAMNELSKAFDAKLRGQS